ncbi:MAG TPA: hypothetical protein VF579_14445, partial [Candidatus Methylomirabilis sp.]
GDGAVRDAHDESGPGSEGISALLFSGEGGEPGGALCARSGEIQPAAELDEIEEASNRAAFVV